MAARENQGLQIALILFVMVTVVLAVTTYIYYRKSEEKVKEAQAAKEAADKATASATAHEKATELIKVTIGASSKNVAELDQIRNELNRTTLPIKDEIKKIEDKFKVDMQNFSADWAGEKNYTTLPEYYLTIIAERNNAIVIAQAESARLTKEKQDAVAGETKKTQEAQKLQQAAFAEKDKIKADYDTDRTGFVAQQADLSAKVDAKAKELKAVADDGAKTKATLEKVAEGLAKEKQIVLDKLKGLQTPQFDVPDGRLTWVNQKTNVVWINLGAADGLRRQITFSVFPKDNTDLKEKDAKGSIEVTKLIDEHLAECRIISSKDSNPLLPGDLCFSPTWHPGQSLHFAIAGLVDYNNDGKSDRALLQSLIQMSGGMVDAEVLDDGKYTGKMSVDTRYLVVGKAPTDKSAKEALDGYSRILADAKNLGVEQISVTKMLDLMGYKGEVSTVTLGKGATGDDIRAKTGSVPGKSSGDTSDIFKKRGPPARGKDGAF